MRGACLVTLLAAVCAAAATSPPAAHADTLVSLGDSFASGEGVGSDNYDAGTDGGGGCHRSYLAWPRLLGVAKENHLACSGAVIANLHPGHRANRPDAGLGQIERLEDLAAETRFDRVLLTIGGNDINFAHRVRDCFIADAACLRNLGDIRRDLVALRPTLTERYKEVAAAAAAPLLVVGYPNIMPPEDAKVPSGCWVSKASRARASAVVAALDATFRAAAAEATKTAKHPVDFLSIAGALRGHELCMKDDSWVYPVTGTIGGQQRAHPLATGQWAMAQVVQEWLDRHQGSCVASDSVAAMIDDSGSMEENDPQGIRRRAVELLLSKPAAQARTFGAVQFAGDADAIFSPAVVSAQQAPMLTALDALRDDGVGPDDSGGTDYNAAFRARSDGQPQATSQIFLTDGAHNVGEYENLHFGGPPTYVIGLNIGPDGEGDDDADRLARIAAETGGVYYPLRMAADDTAEVQVGRLQGVVNEIDAKLTCAASARTTPTTLTSPNRRSVAVGGLIRPRQRAVEVVISWGTEAADVDLGSAVVRDRGGRVVGDLQGVRRIRPRNPRKRTKIVPNVVEGRTFDIVTLPVPASGRSLSVTVTAPVLPAPTDVTVQIRPASGGLPPGHTAVESMSEAPAGAGPAGSGGAVTPAPPPPGTSAPAPAPQAPPIRVDAYSNYGPATAWHAMCRGNPARPESMPGGTATQTFTVPDGVASLDSAVAQIDPDSRVTAHGSLRVNGELRATADAAAAGDTRFNFAPVRVAPGDQVAFAFWLSASFGKVSTTYSAGATGGTFTVNNSCSAAPSTSGNGLRAVVSGWSR